MKEPEALPAPPAGEDIHFPGPSILPLLNAAGLALAIIGITLSTLLTIAGGILFVVTTIIWIADTRRDIADLPLHHGDH